MEITALWFSWRLCDFMVEFRGNSLMELHIVYSAITGLMGPDQGGYGRHPD